MRFVPFYLSAITILSVSSLFADHLVPDGYSASERKGVTSGYYLGFSSLADELRQLRRPSDIPVTDGFKKPFI